MNHVEELKKHFGSSARSYLKEHFSDSLVQNIIDDRKEMIPFLIKNGLGSSKDSTDEIETIFFNGFDGVKKILLDFANNKITNLHLVKSEVIHVLKSHDLFKLKEKPKRVFLIGSFAKGMNHEESDIDILVEISPKKDLTEEEIAEKYRNKIRKFFIDHNIREKRDSVHPQLRGRRVDVYFTYDADSESRPKIEIL